MDNNFQNTINELTALANGFTEVAKRIPNGVSEEELSKMTPDQLEYYNNTVKPMLDPKSKEKTNILKEISGLTKDLQEAQNKAK